MVKDKPKNTRLAQQNSHTGSTSTSTNPQGQLVKKTAAKTGPKTVSKVSQSLSDSTITVNKTKITGLVSSPEHPTVQYHLPENHAKPKVTQSETVASNHVNNNNNFKTSRVTGPKISTNSTRLIQQYPHKFCSESNESTKDLKTKVTTAVPNDHNHSTDAVSLRANKSENKSIAEISISTELFCIPSKKVQAQGSKSEMLSSSELKKPLSLMEQKKQQWAREKEELNGLWSPWGRPLSNTIHPATTQTYVNKLQSSTLQSECHLPPILNNLSPAKQQQQKSLWNAEVDKEAVGLRVSRKTSLPICINATTGEVHYNHSQVGSLQQTDTFQVNNAVMISSNNNLHNALNISAVKYDSHSKAMETNSKRTSSHFQQQSAHSVTSTTNGGWSSMDEEAFTSGYHSEVNGCLSNEEYSGVSRNGSGDGPRVGGEASKGKGGGGQRGGPGGSDPLASNVIIHNISVDRRSNYHGTEERKHKDTKNNNLHPHCNNNKVINPTPSAMRSSITVGLDSAVSNTDSYKEIQKLEKEKWLSELEKQREEQRIRKQMEKDEKRPKWGDKGIGVGHFWEPSQSNDHLPQPSRDDTAIANAPAWLEKGLSRMQNSVSQPSLYNGGNNQNNTEFQGSGNLFSNQSSVDLRNVVGINDTSQNDRNYLRGQNVPPDPEIVAEKERKRLAAIEHQEAIRKQIEERQQRIKEEKERRLKEELEDEEKAKFQRLRELELLELEARKMRYYNNCHNTSEEGDEPKYQYDLAETKDIRKILKTEDDENEVDEPQEKEPKEKEDRRLSVGSEAAIPDPETNPPTDSIFPSNYITSSQSMINISRQGSYKDETLPATPFPDIEPTPEPERNTSSTRSRSLSNQREFGTQTDLEAKADSKNGQKHRSHNCLVKGSKSKGSTGEESESKKKAEKPRWGVAQNKKQYVKQSEKDPLYQQRLKRRMDRIKKIEDRLHGVNSVGVGGGDTGTESEELPSTRSRGRSPPSRFRNRHFNNNNASVHRAPSESNISPRKQVPLKATARIQVNHSKPPTTNNTPRENFSNSNHDAATHRARKIFPDIPGRTIGPLNASNNADFDPFGLKHQGSSENSSRFSSPSLESINSKNVETHYFKQLVGEDGDTVEVDLESRFVSSTSRSVEIRYDDPHNSIESRLISPTAKKTIIESSSDEVMYRKTVFGNTKTIQSEPDVSIPHKAYQDAEKYRRCHSQFQNSSSRNKNSSNLTTSQGTTSSQKTSRYSENNSNCSRHYEKGEKRSRSKASPIKGAMSPIIQNNVSPAPNPITIPTRMGSPPVPALLKKLQAGIPIEDIAVCDDFLYEIPRAQTAGSTSNGYKSVESDSSSHVPIRSRLSSSGGLEIDIDPNYELAAIQLRSQSPPNADFPEDKEDDYEGDEGEKEDYEKDLFEEERNSFREKGRYRDELESFKDDKGSFKDDKGSIRDENYSTRDDQDSLRDEKDSIKDEKDSLRDEKDSLLDEKVEFEDEKEDEEEYDKEEDDESKQFEPYDEEEEDEDEPEKEEELYDQPLYPYPVEKLKPRLPSPSLQVKKEDSPSRPRVSSRTTTLEVMADYRKFNLPDYDYDSVKLFPHVDIGGMDVTAAVHNIRRPGTQDTDLSKREKLISYVINNKDVQAQISARDSELSEKGIIEFNVRLPANSDDAYGDYMDYKDPLLSERQRATIRWLYSSDSSSNSKDSILTHLSYLKKGIQQQQQEWNVVPSDTEDTGCDEDDSLSHNYSGGSTNDNSSEDSKFSSQS